MRNKGAVNPEGKGACELPGGIEVEEMINITYCVRKYIFNKMKKMKKKLKRFHYLRCWMKDLKFIPNQKSGVMTSYSSPVVENVLLISWLTGISVFHKWH